MGTITLTAFAGSASASSSSDELSYVVTVDENGRRTVKAREDVAHDGVSTSGYCADNCSPHCCSDCASDCDEKCGGCICADPGC